MRAEEGKPDFGASSADCCTGVGQRIVLDKESVGAKRGIQWLLCMVRDRVEMLEVSLWVLSVRGRCRSLTRKSSAPLIERSDVV